MPKNTLEKRVTDARSKQGGVGGPQQTFPLDVLKAILSMGNKAVTGYDKINQRVMNPDGRPPRGSFDLIERLLNSTKKPKKNK